MTNINELTDSQMRAFDIIVEPKKKISRVTGYAGTGKTTVLAAAAKELGAECCILTPTNKAAKVLREKGVDRAQTVHSFLYTPAEVEVYQKDKTGAVLYQKNPDGTDMMYRGEKVPLVARKEMGFSLKADPTNVPSIAIVDEASMIGKEIYQDLLATFDHIVLVGDGFQLPPVMDTDVLNLEPADISLTEVHRVALDNPIIRFATQIRSGGEPDFNEYKDDNKTIGVCSINHPKLYKSLVDNQCQAICGRNKTRHDINSKMRAALGYEPNSLLAGEEIVCLENWREEDDYGARSLIFYNGQTAIVEGNYKETGDDMIAQLVRLEKNGQKFIFPFWNKGYFNLFDARDSAWWNEYKRRQASPTEKKPLRGIKFDYSYGITAHKSQGSEYNNVAVFDERSASRGYEQRWYYTAVTRAKKRLLVIR